MDKDLALIFSISLILLLAVVVAMVVIENNTIVEVVKEVPCYDLRHNKIIGQTCLLEDKCGAVSKALNMGCGE